MTDESVINARRQAARACCSDENVLLDAWARLDDPVGNLDPLYRLSFELVSLVEGYLSARRMIRHQAAEHAAAQAAIRELDAHRVAHGLPCPRCNYPPHEGPQYHYGHCPIERAFHGDPATVKPEEFEPLGLTRLEVSALTEIAIMLEREGVWHSELARLVGSAVSKLRAGRGAYERLIHLLDAPTYSRVPWGRYVMQFECLRGTVRTQLRKPLPWGGVAHLSVAPRTIQASGIARGWRGAVKQRAAINAARYWMDAARYWKERAMSPSRWAVSDGKELLVHAQAYFAVWKEKQATTGEP